jgi:hypothetical protein
VSDDPWAQFVPKDTLATPDADPWAQFVPKAAPAPQAPGWMSWVGKPHMEGGKPELLPSKDIFGQDVGAMQREEQAIGAGAIEPLAGAGELIPGAQPFAAGASRYLHGQAKDYPNAEMLGYTLPFMFGGGLGAAEKVGSLIPKVEEGAGLWERLITSAARGSLTGATLSAEAGALSPAGESKEKPEEPPDYLTSLGRHGQSAAIGGLGGGILGTVAGAAGPVAGEVLNVVKGAPVKKALGELSGEAAGRVSPVVKEKSAEAAAAEKSKSESERDLTVRNAELAKIEAAQHQLAEREATRSQAAVVGRHPITGKPTMGSRDVTQTLDPQKTAEIRTQVSAKLRARVWDAEKAAKEAGLEEKEARAFAVQQEARVVDSEQAAQTLVQELQAQPAMDAKTFGGRVRNLAAKVYEKYRDIRERQSGYSAAIAEAGETPIVDTSKIKGLLREWKKETASASEKSIIDYIEDNISTKRNVGEGRATVRMINVKRADSLRKELDTLYRTKNLTVIGKGEGSAASAAYRVARIHAMLKQAIATADPRLAEATKRFRALSRPLDFLERKGPLAGALRKDPLSGDYLMERAKLVEGLLTRTRAGGDPFARLIAEDPSLRNDARLYFQYRLFGEEGFEKPVTQAKIDKFLIDNKDALDQTGLLSEFQDIKTATTTAKRAIEEAKSEAESASGAVKEAAALTKEAQASVKSKQQLSDRAAAREQELLAQKQADFGKPAEARARQATERLRLEAAAKRGDVKTVQEALNAAEKAGRVSSEVAHKYDTLLTEMQSAINTGKVSKVASVTRRAFEQLNNDKRITQIEYGFALDKIAELEAKDVNRKVAIGILVSSALTAALYAEGWRLYHLLRIFTAAL